MRKWIFVGRIYGMKCSWKGHKDRNRHKNRIKRSGQAQLVHVKGINQNIPTTWGWAHEDFQWVKISNETAMYIQKVQNVASFHQITTNFVTMSTNCWPNCLKVVAYGPSCFNVSGFCERVLFFHAPNQENIKMNYSGANGFALDTTSL